MSLFIIKRNFAEQLEISDAGVVEIGKINGAVGVTGLRESSQAQAPH